MASKSGRGWRGQVRVVGYPAEYKSFPKKAQALLWEETRKDELRAGKRGDYPKKTVREALERFRLEEAPLRKGARLAADLGLGTIARSTLVGAEWNALTYAGNTVWNVHREFKPGRGYSGGGKRRPRSEWVIQPRTHEALIAEEEAEAILARLERGRAAGYHTRATYLLSGILRAPNDGVAWHGNRKGELLFYRAGKTNVKAEHIERAIVDRIAIDLRSSAFVNELTEEFRRERDAAGDAAELKAAQGALAEIDRKIARLMALVPETTAPRPLLEQAEKLEAERAPVLARAAALRRAVELGRQARRIEPRDVAAFLSGLAVQCDGSSRADLKDLVAGLVGRVELDPATLRCRIFYEIPLQGGVLVASPRGRAEIPTLRHESEFAIVPLRRRSA